ncbi:MAG: hypothetical protein QOJ91_1289, partial [Sphingomonadales bacterium]|nr:hypothetical protein [Sphingomonadales bacterium]
GTGFGRVACGIQDLRGTRRARFPVFTRDQPPGLSGAAVTQGKLMQDEAEEPAKSKSTKPTRAEILLVGAAWALFVVTLIVGFRTWSGGWH